MKKVGIKFIYSSLLTFALITAGFYFLVLKPKLELPRKLIVVEEVISINHFNLVQNRLSILNLTKLDANSPNLGNQNTSLIEKALETNLKGLEDLKNPPFIRRLEKSSNVNTEELFKLNKSILEEQQVLLIELKALGDVSNNIFKYNPLADLGALDLQLETERQVIIERSYNAIEGLGKMKNNLEQLENSKKISNLTLDVITTQELIGEQITQIESGEYEEASLTFLKVVNRFEELRSSGLNLEKAVLHNATSVEILTKQTNLMHKYEYILEKINELQEALPKVDLYSLF